jgi:hypothetical protein
VLPLPPEAQGNWLPAEQITLHDSWQAEPRHLRVGDQTTRIITIEAKGLAASQLPPLAFTRTGSYRLYPQAPNKQRERDHA